MWRLLPLSLLLSLSAGCALLRGSPEPDPMSAQDEEDWTSGVTVKRAGKESPVIEMIDLREDSATAAPASADQAEARVEAPKFEVKAVKTPKLGKKARKAALEAAAGEEKAAVESVAVAEKVPMPAVQGSLASSAVPLTPVTPAYP